MTLHERIAAVKKVLDSARFENCNYVDVAKSEANEMAAIITEQQEIINIICTPRRWTREMNDAWHQNIPDVDKAFKALLTTALKGE